MKKIVLLCSAGMSTGILVKKMQAVAEKEGYACTIAAYPLAKAKTEAADADVILLGPQVRFQKDKVAAECPGVPVEAIDMHIYGCMDGKATLELAKSLMKD